MSSSVLGLLEAALRDEPTGLEPVCRRGASASDYRVYLIRSYGFYAALESQAAMVPGLDRELDLKPRAKAGLIAADLLALGMRPVEIANLPLCRMIPAFHSIHQAFGWIYVVERTTLGFELARMHLAAVMPREIAAASALLTCYGDRTDVRWRELCEHVTRLATGAPEALAIVHGALAAGAHRMRWLDTMESTRQAG